MREFSERKAIRFSGGFQVFRFYSSDFYRIFDKKQLPSLISWKHLKKRQVNVQSKIYFFKKLQFFGFAVDVSVGSLVKAPAVTKSTSIFFWKKDNGNQMHGKKYYRSQNSLGIITVHKSLGRNTYVDENKDVSSQWSGRGSSKR